MKNRDVDVDKQQPPDLIKTTPFPRQLKADHGDDLPFLSSELSFLNHRLNSRFWRFKILNFKIFLVQTSESWNVTLLNSGFGMLKSLIQDSASDLSKTWIYNKLSFQNRVSRILHGLSGFFHSRRCHNSTWTILLPASASFVVIEGILDDIIKFSRKN